MNEYLLWFRTAIAIKRETEARAASGRPGEVSKPELKTTPKK